MTLLLLLFGTISDVFVVRATWPIVRYKNGTVGVKNDGGTVKVQSTDLIVDGNLSVSGSLFIQDRDLAEYEDRVSFLETALGDPALLNLSNCSSVTYRSPTAYPKEATEWDYLSIPSVVSGITQFSLSWTDIKSICTHKGYILCSSETFCTNYVPPSALDIPEHDSWIAVGDSENEWLTFRRGWNNRICKTHTEVAGSKPSWGTSNFTGTTGDMYRAGLCCSVGDTSESMCTSNDNNTTTSVVSQLQSLTPPKCMRPGGTGLFFNGTSWICECVQNSTHVLHGESCENTCIQNATQIWNTTTSSCQEIVTQVTDLTLTKPSSLTHWFDFSDTDEYGSTELAVMTNFTDKMGGASSMTVNYNVQYKLNVQNGLNAIYANEQYASLQFSSKSGSNPEVFVAYRIVNNVGGRSLPHCFIFGGRAGYAFGSQWSGNTEPSYDAINVVDAAGYALASLAAPFDGWHLADIYYGASDGFFKVDHGESESIAIAANRPNPCGGCNGAYQDTELTNVAIGGFPWWPNIFCENYIGEVLIFNEKLSDSDRSMITSYLMTKWAIGNNAQQK